MTLHEKLLQDFFVLIPHLGHCVVDQCIPGIVFLVRTVSRTAFIFVILIVIIMGRVRPMLSLDEMDASCIGITRFLWRRTLLAIIVSVWTIFIFVPSKIIIASKYLSTILTVHVCRSASVQMTKKLVYSLISAKRIWRTHRPRIDLTSTSQ